MSQKDMIVEETGTESQDAPEEYACATEDKNQSDQHTEGIQVFLKMCSYAL